VTNALRRGAALLVTAAAALLAAAAQLAVALGGFVLEGTLYAAFALLLLSTARRVRPRRRFLFARR
jgi:membrane protein implicated in regulation of membrane protease activity